MSREALDARLIAMLDAIGHVPETPVTADELRALVQAAEKETARRCAQVAGPEDSYQDEHFKAKADSVNRIRAEYPEAFK